MLRLVSLLEISSYHPHPALPLQGGGDFKGALLFPLPWRPPARRAYASERRGLGGGGEKWDFLYYQDILSVSDGDMAVRLEVGIDWAR